MHKYQITKRAFGIYHSYNPKYFPLKFLQIIFKNISPYFNLWLSSEIVTALYEGRDVEKIVFLVAVTLAGNLMIQVIGSILSTAAAVQSEILSNHETAAFHRKTLSLDYDKLENPAIRQHRRKITESTYINGYGVAYMKNNIETALQSLINLVFSLFLFVEMLSLIAAVGFHGLGTLLLLAMIASVVLTLIFQSRHTAKHAACWKSIGDLMLEENRMGQGYHPSGMDNRIYRQQEYISKLYEKSNRTHLTVFSEANKKDFIYMTPAILFSKLSELCAYLIICFYCTLGAFPVGSIIKYVGYLSRVTSNVGSLFDAGKKLKANEPFLQTYLDYFDINNDMYQGSLAVEKRSDKKYDVEFRNVSFRYAGAEDWAIKNLNLSLPVGERLAVVGMNGSGKTTFIKLLCRLYDPTEGEIRMNDFNIQKYDYRQYLDLFSVVFQDFHLLAVPLGNNVSSRGTWDEKRAARLLEEVGFGDRYAGMPKKLETPLYKNFDEDGVNISGGEAQKIALARALYKDAPFIILDEPTAALDPVSEAEIYSRFDAIVGDKTAIYISHRLSSCRFCDRILVFDQGRIVQAGTHEELVADIAGKYYELWHAQAQYYGTKSASTSC